MMNTLLAASVFAVLFSPAPIVQDAKPDFSGTWTMDASKSDFGQMPAPQSIVIVIEHKEPALKATVTQKTSEGEMTSTRNLTTDGKENKNTVRTMEGEQPITSTSKWDGKVLATAFSLTIQNMAISVNESWELAPDGKTLTATREFATDQGSFAQKVVYTKQ
jgi:hypothetical protein